MCTCFGGITSFCRTAFKIKTVFRVACLTVKFNLNQFHIWFTSAALEINNLHNNKKWLFKVGLIISHMKIKERPFIINGDVTKLT